MDNSLRASEATFVLMCSHKVYYRWIPQHYGNWRTKGHDVNTDQSAGIMVIDVMPSSSHGKMCWNPSMCSKGKGLEGFITWCMPLLTSRSICSHLGLFSPLHSSFPEFSCFFSVQFVLQVRLLLDRSWLATVHDISSGTHHVINPSRPSPTFSYCKQGRGGLGMRLIWGTID